MTTDQIADRLDRIRDASYLPLPDGDRQMMPHVRKALDKLVEELRRTGRG